MYLLCKFHSFRLLQSEGIENEEYKSSLERDNVNFRSTVARQSERVGQLERQSPQSENSARLQGLVKIQNEKIHYYQQEIEQSKVDMLRLETLVQEVQKQSVRRDVYHNSLVRINDHDPIACSMLTEYKFRNILLQLNFSFFSLW